MVGTYLLQGSGGTSCQKLWILLLRYWTHLPQSCTFQDIGHIFHNPANSKVFDTFATFQDIGHIFHIPAHSKILDTFAAVLHIPRYWTFLPHYCDLTMLILIIKLVMWIRIRWKANRILNPHQPPCGLLPRRKTPWKKKKKNHMVHCRYYTFFYFSQYSIKIWEKL